VELREDGLVVVEKVVLDGELMDSASVDALLGDAVSWRGEIQRFVCP
jgi:hypothetical protein